MRSVNSHKRWITFAYFGPQIRTITNLLKHANLCVALQTTSTIPGFFKTHIKKYYNLYDNVGIYCSTCVTCIPKLRWPNR